MKRSTPYLSGIDFLRAVAILGVVFYHIWPQRMKGGYLGVCLFFMISGYLLTVRCEQDYLKGQFHIGEFYGKRIRKIYPHLFMMIISVSAYLTLFQRELLVGMREEVFSIFLGYNKMEYVFLCV